MLSVLTIILTAAIVSSALLAASSFVTLKGVYTDDWCNASIYCTSILGHTHIALLVYFKIALKETSPS